MTSSTAEPRWLTCARSLIGIKEVPGPANSPTIIGWAKALGAKILGIAYTADSTPWCSLFTAHVMSSVGLTPPLIAIRASSWDRWGVGLAKFYLGAIVRFERSGGGHVGIVVGQDATHLRVLGGNQGDAVGLAWIEKDRCVAIRWPMGELMPTILAPMMVRTGAVSTNEA